MMQSNIKMALSGAAEILAGAAFTQMAQDAD
jgi:hypothetical protein